MLSWQVHVVTYPRAGPSPHPAFFTFVQLVARDLLISVAVDQPREKEHGWLKPSVAFMLPSWRPLSQHPVLVCGHMISPDLWAIVHRTTRGCWEVFFSL